jgi:hypothetical protein
MTPILWKKPRNVTVDAGFLVADFRHAQAYALLPAVADGRALQAFTTTATDSQACEFTATWGFLHHRGEQGRWDRYPLALFHAMRQRVLAISQLMTMLHSKRGLGGMREALADLRDARAAVDRASGFAQPVNRITLTEREQSFVDVGIPALVVLPFHARPDVTLPDLRWTLRAGFGRWHYRRCQGCGIEWIAGRSNARFCSEKCGTRVRVRRFRRPSDR